MTELVICFLRVEGFNLLFAFLFVLEEHVTSRERSNIMGFYCSVSYVEVLLEKCRRNKQKSLKVCIALRR